MSFCGHCPHCRAELAREIAEDRATWTAEDEADVAAWIAAPPLEKP